MATFALVAAQKRDPLTKFVYFPLVVRGSLAGIGYRMFLASVPKSSFCAADTLAAVPSVYQDCVAQAQNDLGSSRGGCGIIQVQVWGIKPPDFQLNNRYVRL